MTVSLERLAYAAVLVVATLAGLASTLLGLFLDWRAMALVAVGIAATGTIVLQSQLPTTEVVGLSVDSPSDSVTEEAVYSPFSFTVPDVSAH